MQVSGQCKFVAFIDKLISKVGFDKVVGGYTTQASPFLHEETTNELSSRAWIAAEMLCTWKWPGGSALGSFLPSLSAYAKSGSNTSGQGLLDSVFNILLDGALVHGESCAKSLHSSVGDKVEDIEEPYLRGLVALLITLFRDNLWDSVKAVTLFEMLQRKLFIGESVNINCLHILPLIVSVLIRQLTKGGIFSVECNGVVDRDAVEDNQVQHTIKSWLHRALSFPPLFMWQPEKGTCVLLYLFMELDKILFLKVQLFLC